MVVFINGAFGIGKTTVAHQLSARIAGSTIFDPEPIGLALLFVNAIVRWRKGVDDFQNLPSWRWICVRLIRIALRLRKTIIVPMAFSNASYLDEFLSYLRSRDVPVRHFCLTAPHRVVLERLWAREGRRGPTEWQIRRSAECCDAHEAVEFGVHVPTAGRTANEVVDEIAKQI